MNLPKNFLVGSPVLAHRKNLIGGRIGNAALFQLKKRGFAQPRIFQLAERKARKRRRARRLMLRHFENDCVGKTGEPHHLKFASADSELIHSGEFENGVFAHARLHETGHCFASCERFAALMINLHDAHARVVRKSCAAHFGNFRNFFGRDFQGFEFFDGGVTDAGSIERFCIERLKMLAAWRHQ